MVGDTNAWTNLSTFRGHGGKLIFLHGLSDPWFSAQDTVQYYERLGRDNAEAPLASGAGCSWCPAWATAPAARARSTTSTC